MQEAHSVDHLVLGTPTGSLSDPLHVHPDRITCEVTTSATDDAAERPQILPQPRHCCSSKVAADTAAAKTLATGDAAEKAAASSGTTGTFISQGIS